MGFKPHRKAAMRQILLEEEARIVACLARATSCCGCGCCCGGDEEIHGPPRELLKEWGYEGDYYEGFKKVSQTSDGRENNGA